MQTAQRFALSVLCASCAVILGVGLVHSAVLMRTSSTHNSNPVKDQSDDSPALTIYNQKFAVVRQTLPLELKPGANNVEVTDITSHLEPDSVILRPLDTTRHLQILEQNYRNDPISQELLLSLFEGKTIDFQVPEPGGALWCCSTCPRTRYCTGG